MRLIICEIGAYDHDMAFWGVQDSWAWPLSQVVCSRGAGLKIKMVRINADFPKRRQMRSKKLFSLMILNLISDPRECWGCEKMYSDDGI